MNLTKTLGIGDKHSPRRFVVAGYAVIVLTFGVIGGWTATARLDQAVIAPGTVDVASNRKEVQHLEGGIINQILVEEGDTVAAGDVLMRLNDVEASSNLQVLSIRTRIARAADARSLAERRMADTIEWPPELLDDDTPQVAAAISDQRAIFEDRVSLMRSQVDILRNQTEQLRREIEGLRIQQVAFADRVVILGEELERLRRGQERGVVEANFVSRKEEEFIEVRANIGRMQTEIARVEKSIGETGLQILQVEQQFKERASAEYEDIRSTLQELTEHRKVAADVLSRMQIRAPVDGVAQNLRFHTTGGVIRPGEVVVDIVPTDDRMIINAQVSPLDIDNVYGGLRAEVRFSAFPGRFMPIIIGEVDQVSRASIVPEDPRQPPYFLARINVDKAEIPDDVESRLSPGMPTDVVISVGERTVIDYLVSPLTDAVRKSMREE